MKTPSKKIIAVVTTLLSLLLLLLTRLINLDWGLPYPFHPDERNMVDAIMRLECPSLASLSDIQTCLNPEFFAYGQAPLYISYVGLHIWEGFTSLLAQTNLLPTLYSSGFTFTEVAMSLRIQSALYSMLTVAVLYAMLKKILAHMPQRAKHAHFLLPIGLLIFIFQPYFIQFSHFGTTESLLMLLYSSLVFVCMKLREKITMKRVVATSLLLGISVGVKLSSLTFAFVPACIILYVILRDAIMHKKPLRKTLQTLSRTALVGISVTALAFALTSPHYLINAASFLGGMDYELGVGSGKYRVFYTRQFEDTIPYLFQFVKVFPFTHGAFQLALFIGSFILLPWKNPRLNILRLAFLAYFLPTGFAYTKWARFMAPIMPAMTLLAYVGLVHATQRIRSIHIQRSLLALCTFLLILPGLAYLSVYASRDTRFEASEWMTQNIAPEEHVLIETGNVINLPVPDPERPAHTSGGQFSMTAFDFYNVDESEELQHSLAQEVDRADYIIIASRRVFANHTCLWPDRLQVKSLNEQLNPLASGKLPGWCDRKVQLYPVLSEFYRDLFDPEKYELVQLITSPPRIGLWDTPLLHFDDEHAEEAWTVFDHPTVRVYRRRI